MRTRLVTDPLLSKTSVSNNQDPSPGVTYPGQNPPNITYAGGRPIYAQQYTDVTFNNLTLTGAFSPASLAVSTITASSITTGFANVTRLDLDGNILTTAGTAPSELLLNGIPIATTSNISSIADWAFEPAISSVNMNYNDLYNVSTINGLPYSVYSPVDVGNWANYKAISSVNVNSGNIINTGQISFNSATSNILTTDEANNLIYNGSNISGGSGGNVADWATYSAVQNVDMAGHILTSATATGVTADAGSSALTTPQIALNSVNGNGGNVSIVADTGYLGTSYGKVSIQANGGTTLGVGVGGLVEITATTPVSTDPTASGAIKLSAAGINSYAGAVPSIGSLAGYNFIYGTGGVNICAGVPSLLPNFPGTTYIYGTNGIQLNSDVYTTRILPYWNGITSNVAPLVISGRPASFGFHSAGDLVLENVSTINGVAPGGGATWVGTATSELDMVNFGITNISSMTGVSSINGSVYPPPAFAISVPPTCVLYSTDGTNVTGSADMVYDVEGQRLTANNITASFDLTINSDASLNVGGSTGSAGQVVAITTGDYPVWSFPPPPSVISITLNGIDTVTEVPDLGRYYPVDTDVGGTNYTIVFDVTAVAGGTSWYIKNVTAIPVSIRYDAGAGITDATFFGGAVALIPEQGYSVCAWDGATLTIY